MPIEAQNLVCILAHHGDETLFVGGLLYRRALDPDCKTHLITVCDVSVEDPTENLQKEDVRQQERYKAWIATTKALLKLHSTAELKISMNLSENSSAQDCMNFHNNLLDALPPLENDAVIVTHPASCHAHHPCYTAVHKAVIEKYPGNLILTYGDEQAPIQYPINIWNKQWLQTQYMYGTTKDGLWIPSEDSKYASWNRDYEGYVGLNSLDLSSVGVN